MNYSMEEIKIKRNNNYVYPPDFRCITVVLVRL